MVIIALGQGIGEVGEHQSSSIMITLEFVTLEHMLIELKIC